MECQHDGYHAIGTSYDRRRGMLIFVWTCEQCGSRLGEAGRQKYRPAPSWLPNRPFEHPGGQAQKQKTLH